LRGGSHRQFSSHPAAAGAGGEDVERVRVIVAGRSVAPSLRAREYRPRERGVPIHGELGGEHGGEGAPSSAAVPELSPAAELVVGGGTHHLS